MPSVAVRKIDPVPSAPVIKRDQAPGALVSTRDPAPGAAVSKRDPGSKVIRPMWEIKCGSSKIKRKKVEEEIVRAHAPPGLSLEEEDVHEGFTGYKMNIIVKWVR